MTFELFITILTISATATSIAVQIIKNILDSLGKTYKSVPVAVIMSIVVGIAEIFIYYKINNMTIEPLTFVYAICMGVANAVGATTSYDLVKKFISALFGK